MHHLSDVKSCGALAFLRKIQLIRRTPPRIGLQCPRLFANLKFPILDLKFLFVLSVLNLFLPSPHSPSTARATQPPTPQRLTLDVFSAPCQRRNMAPFLRSPGSQPEKRCL